MPERLLLPLLLALIGLRLLGIALWLRAGRPPAVRGWRGPLGENWMAERVVLLGRPTAGAETGRHRT